MKISILIADDNTVMRNLIKYYLKSFNNIEIHEAKDGIKTLEKIKTQNIHILFLDLSMPNLDGMNVANYLKKSNHQKLHIVSISSEITQQNRTLLKQMGVKYFLGKPLEANAFKDITTTLISEITN